MSDIEFHHEHTVEPMLANLPARPYRWPVLDRQWRDVIIVVTGAVISALLGAGLATYLALPFNMG